MSKNSILLAVLSLLILAVVALVVSGNLEDKSTTDTDSTPAAPTSTESAEPEPSLILQEDAEEATVPVEAPQAATPSTETN